MNEGILSLQDLQNENEKNYVDLTVLKNEVVKSLLGSSPFKPELLSSLIGEKEKAIDDTSREITAIEQKIKCKQIAYDDLDHLQKEIPNWQKTFNKATIDTKKEMLSYVIDHIDIFTDRAKVHFKALLQEFVTSSHG